VGCFFRYILGLLCSSASVGLDFGCLLWFRSASASLIFGCLWVLVVVGVFLFFLGVSGFVGVVGEFCCFWACSWVLGLLVLLVYCLCTGAPYAFLIKLLFTYKKKLLFFDK
jgi:hypothetical protein